MGATAGLSSSVQRKRTLLGQASSGHPARVRILRLLSRKEARVCSQIVDELPLAQSTVSEHLRILKDCGLIRSREEGSRVGYCINYEVLRRLKALVAII